MYCLQHCTNCDKIMSPSEEAIVHERTDGESDDVCLDCLGEVNFHDYVDYSEDYYDDYDY